MKLKSKFKIIVTVVAIVMLGLSSIVIGGSVELLEEVEENRVMSEVLGSVLELNFILNEDHHGDLTKMREKFTSKIQFINKITEKSIANEERELILLDELKQLMAGLELNFKNEIELGKFSRTFTNLETITVKAQEVLQLTRTELVVFIFLVLFSSLFTILFLLIAVFIVLWIFFKQVLSPLSMLQKGTEKISHNNFNYKIPIKSKDEIGLISKGFNEMTAQLKDIYKNLDDQVRKRTLELESEKMKVEEKVVKADRLKAATLNILEDVKEVEGKLALQNALLEAQYSSSPDGMVVVGESGGIISYNQSFVRIWGIPANILKTMDDEKMIQYAIGLSKNPDKFYEKIKYYYSNKSKPGKFQIKLKNEQVIDIASTPMKGNGGKYYGRAWYFRDITREAEIDRAKTEFVSLASHQLRTPLTSIKWILEKTLGRKEELAEWQKEFLPDALKSTERMIELVNDLLNVSRIEANVLNVESKKTDLGDFIETITKEAMIVAKTNNQKIDFKKPNPKIFAHLDPQLISQVIGNLISNAISYSDSNTTITITAKKIGNHIKISVKDQGIGISKKDQKRLFSKFFRSVEASKRSTTGSGLGLYVIDKVLDVCKGSIQVDSKKGEGTIFTVTLPVKGPVHKGDKSLTEHTFKN